MACVQLVRNLYANIYNHKVHECLALGEQATWTHTTSMQIEKQLAFLAPLALGALGKPQDMFAIATMLELQLQLLCPASMACQFISIHVMQLNCSVPSPFADRQLWLLFKLPLGLSRDAAHAYAQARIGTDSGQRKLEWFSSASSSLFFCNLLPHLRPVAVSMPSTDRNPKHILLQLCCCCCCYCWRRVKTALAVELIWPLVRQAIIMQFLVNMLWMQLPEMHKVPCGCGQKTWTF